MHLSRDALSAINSTAEAVSSLESIRNCTSGSLWLAALEPPLADDYQSREVQFYLDARACMSRAAERLCAAGSDAAQVGVSMTAFAEDVSSRGIELHTAIVSRVPGKAAKAGKHDDAGFFSSSWFSSQGEEKAPQESVEINVSDVERCRVAREALIASAKKLLKAAWIAIPADADGHDSEHQDVATIAARNSLHRCRDAFVSLARQVYL